MGGIDDPRTDCGGCGENVGADALDEYFMCASCRERAGGK